MGGHGTVASDEAEQVPPSIVSGAWECMHRKGTMDASVLQFRRPGGEEKKSTIIRTGENAWRSAKADKVAFVIDAADYYMHVEESFRQAKHSIWIIGWDFNPDIHLRPDRPSETLGEFLLSLVESRPELEIRILVWAMGPIYSGKSLSLFRENTWSAHPRITMRFDSKHPLRGSHHQKIVAVDDAIAFLGGIDLTARRWDDSRHLADNPLRVSPTGEPYEPVHDLQAAVTGDGARAIADLARRRWQRATGEEIPAATGANLIWPAGLEANIRGCEIGISLTEPGYLGRRSRKQAMRLTIDALKTAREHIYIETQYFAFFGIAACLESLLRKPDGPEIVIILTRVSHGFLEKVMMGGNRDRLIRRLKRADIQNRLRVLYPVVPKDDGGEQDVVVHSKLLIIDDNFVRIGSSNLNNRSEGLDTEADLAIEAENDDCRAAIASLRDSLLAEHLEAGEEEVAAAMEETGSLLRTTERLNIRRRGLRDMKLRIDKGETEPVWGTDFVDPRRPYWPLQQLRATINHMAAKLLNIFL